MSDRPAMQLTSFRQALASQPEAATQLPPATFYRYVNGNVPAAVRWLMRYPALLRALADDAERDQATSTSVSAN